MNSLHSWRPDSCSIRKPSQTPSRRFDRVDWPYSAETCGTLSAAKASRSRDVGRPLISAQTFHEFTRIREYDAPHSCLRDPTSYSKGIRGRELPLHPRNFHPFEIMVSLRGLRVEALCVETQPEAISSHHIVSYFRHMGLNPVSI